MSLMTEAERALRIKVFRNGDDRYTGKYFVLNRRRIRTWDSFLQAVTLDVKSTEAVRSIRTPTHGSRIESLDQLADDRQYVAVGNGRFKKLQYLNLEGQLAPPKALTPRNAEVKPVVHSRLQVPGRIRTMATEVICINVYCNGLELIPAHRIKLKVGMLRDYPLVLSEVSEKVEHLTGPVMKLYTLDGVELANAGEMKSGDEYVAVGRQIRFFRKKMNYGAKILPFNSSPKRQPSSRNLPPIRYHKMYRSRVSSNQTNTTASRSQATGLDSVTSPGSSEKSHNRTSVARNERVARPPHRTSPKKAEDKVFPAKPIKYRRSDKKQETVDYDKDDGGVFRAKSHQVEAMEVEETKDTKVDRPIDQVAAEEVKDEEIESEHPKKLVRKASRPQKSVSEPYTEKKESEKTEVPETASEVEAATKIQAHYRGYRTRKNMKEDSTGQEAVEDSGNEGEKEKAAVKIQSNYRGYKSRKNVKQLKADEEKKQNNAAVKIQAQYRGYKTRKDVQQDARKPEEALTKQG